MDQQPDKLFRDKLHRYEGAVSPHAWERISTNVGKTSTRSLWLKIAASMLILLAAGVLIFSWRQEPNEPIAEKAVAPEIRKSPSSDERIEEIPSEKEEAAILPKDIASSEGQKVSRKEQKVVTPTEQPP